MVTPLLTTSVPSMIFWYGTTASSYFVTKKPQLGNGRCFSQEEMYNTDLPDGTNGDLITLHNGDVVRLSSTNKIHVMCDTSIRWKHQSFSFEDTASRYVRGCPAGKHLLCVLTQSRCFIGAARKKQFAQNLPLPPTHGTWDNARLFYNYSTGEIHVVGITDWRTNTEHHYAIGYPCTKWTLKASPPVRMCYSTQGNTPLGKPVFFTEHNSKNVCVYVCHEDRWVVVESDLPVSTQHQGVIAWMSCNGKMTSNGATQMMCASPIDKSNAAVACAASLYRLGTPTEVVDMVLGNMQFVIE
jgi:hypothetical protein